MKNATPGQTIFQATVIIFFTSLIFHIAGILIPTLQLSWWYWLLVVPVAVGLASYIVFYIAIERFIYRKIKLIYKTIHNIKSSKTGTEKVMDMNTDVLSEVRKEVVQWSRDKILEIDELKKMESYRKEFLGNVSHELKTPVTVIQGYLETLYDGGLDDPKINKQYIAKSLVNVERMISVIDDLEAITKLESRGLQMKNTSFDICELTKEVFESLEMIAEPKNIFLKV